MHIKQAAKQNSFQ